MIYRCLWLALVCSVALLTVAACDDPSTVGANVGPSPLEGGTPRTVDAFPSRFDTTASPAVTGNANASGWRMLVGRVQDPLAGTIIANGYVDFNGRPQLSDELLNASPEDVAARLEMVRSYQHGDTTATVNVAVYALTEEMDVNEATADQTFPSAAMPLGTASFAANDSLVTIELPSDWIVDNIETLRDTTDGGDSFEDEFHGFRLVAESGGAVVGFDLGDIDLELGGGPDSLSTVPFAAIKTFTHIERTRVASPPPGRQVLVGGAGTALTFAFDYDANPLDTLANASVNAADLSIPVDTTAWDETRPEHFVRPRSDVGYLLLAHRSETPDISCSGVNTAALNDSTCVVPLRSGQFPSAARMDASTGLVLFQEALLGASIFTGYRLEVAVGRGRSNTLGIGLPTTLPVVVYVPGSLDAPDDKWPRAALTVTPS